MRERFESGSSGHLCDPRKVAERAREIDDILGLAGGIRVAPEFQVLTPNQPVYADQDEVKPLRVFLAHDPFDLRDRSRN